MKPAFELPHADDTALIETFLDALWMEHGLSANTLSAYRSDLLGWSAWLRARGQDLLHVERPDLLEYCASRVAQCLQPRSMARLLSTLRRFYQYLVRERRLDVDPTLRIEGPKLGPSLPDTLTEAEVETLLNAPDPAAVRGLRDRAMLEVLYASGLRVSELVGLRLTGEPAAGRGARGGQG